MKLYQLLHITPIFEKNFKTSFERELNWINTYQNEINLETFRVDRRCLFIVKTNQYL